MPPNPSSTILSKHGITTTYADSDVVQHVSLDNETLSVDQGLQVSGKVSKFLKDADAASLVDATASVQLAGGLTVQKKAWIGTDLHVGGKAYLGAIAMAGASLSSDTQSDSTTTGALTVVGGAGIGKNVYIGQKLDVGTTSHLAGNVTMDSQLTVAQKAAFSDEVDVAGILKSSNITDASSSSDSGAALSVAGGLAVVKKAFIGGTLAVTKEVTLSKDTEATSSTAAAVMIAGGLAVAKSAFIGQALDVVAASHLKGAVTMDDTLYVAKKATLHNDLQVDGNAAVTGTLTVTESAELNNGLTVKNASTTLQAGLTVTSGTTSIVDLTTSAAASIGAALHVTGATTLDSTLHVLHGTTLDTTLTVGGIATLSSTANASASSDLTAALSVAGGMAVKKDAWIGGLIDVVGAATLHSTVDIKDAATLESSLAVSGAVALTNNANATSLSTGAVQIAGGMAVAQDAWIGGLIDVAGAATLHSTVDIKDAATLESSLAVSGAVALTNNANATSLSTGAVQITGGMAVAQDAWFGGLIDVAGAATLHSTVDIKDAATLESSLNVSGVVTLSNATDATSKSSGAVKIGGGLGVNNAAWIGGLINVAGNATLQQKLSVESTVAPESLSDSAALAVAGGMTVANDAWMGGKLNVKKEVTFQDDLTVAKNAVISGNLTVNGTTTTVNSQTLDVADAAILIAKGNVSDTKDFGVEGQYGVSAYAGFKRNNTTGEFVFFENATSKIEDGSTGMNYAVVMADSFNCASDARLKKDIYPLENALDKIDSIRGVNYYWRDENQSKERQVGVIAQEIQVVYPELVMEGGNGFLSVDYPKLTAVLIQSVKELKAMVLALAQK